MREILFRGKSKNTGEWVYGMPISNKMITKDISIMTYQDYERVQFGSERIDPETVGQFTGYYDINGIKTFEGDIVKIIYFRTEYKGKIVFNNKSCGYEIWYNRVVGAYGENATGKINFSTDSEIEIIGNTYDNPKLLQGEE